MAGTIIGQYKTGVVHCRDPWQDLEVVEYANLHWVDWFNHRRLLEPIGNLSAAELALAYYPWQNELALAA